jgi:hypothetical protein
MAVMLLDEETFDELSVTTRSSANVMTRKQAFQTTLSLVAMLALFAVASFAGGVLAAIRLSGSARGLVGVFAIVVGGAIIALIAYLLTTPLAADPHRRAIAQSDEYSTLAITAFICAFVTALPGIVLGHLALRDIARTGKRGHGLAVAALILSYLFVALTISLYILVAAVLND